jgi:hypothetical protein
MINFQLKTIRATTATKTRQNNNYTVLVKNMPSLSNLPVADCVSELMVRTLETSGANVRPLTSTIIT